MRRRNRPMSSRRCDRRASTWKVEPLRSLPPSSAAISKSGRALPPRPDSSGSIGSGVWGGQRRAHRNRCCRFRHILSAEVGQARLRCAVPTSSKFQCAPLPGGLRFAHPQCRGMKKRASGRAWEDFLPAIKLLFRGRSTLTFEFLAQLVGALLQIFLQFLLLLLEHLGVGGRTFVGLQEAVA